MRARSAAAAAAVIALVSLVASLAACRGEGPASRTADAAAEVGTVAAPLRDDFGDSVQPSGVSPRTRIVSLNPTTTEVLFAIGAGGRLVPDLGDGLRPNVEAVLATRPDLVVLYASADNRAAAERLHAAGVRTLALKIDRIADFRRALLLLGVATGERARAAAVRDSVAVTLGRVRRSTAGLPRPKVFWHVWDSPLITIGAGSYMTELVEIAGGHNVYADLPDPSPTIAMEDLLHRDPDVVLAGPEGARLIAEGAAWRRLRAVRAGRVLVVDTALVGRPSVRLGEAATAIARLLHPGTTP